MKAIVTVVGQDRVGIIAAVCIKLAEMNVNVLDISQTILDGKFTMVMAADAANANVGLFTMGIPNSCWISSPVLTSFSAYRVIFS